MNDNTGRSSCRNRLMDTVMRCQAIHARRGGQKPAIGDTRSERTKRDIPVVLGSWRMTLRSNTDVTWPDRVPIEGEIAYLDIDPNPVGDGKKGVR